MLVRLALEDDAASAVFRCIPRGVRCTRTPRTHACSEDTARGRIPALTSAYSHCSIHTQVRRAQPRVAAEAAEAAAAAAAAAAVETVGSGEAGSAGFKPVAGLVGVGSLAAPVRVGPRSSATVALVVDLRGLLLDMRELNDALGELEGEVLLVDTRVRLSALGVTLRLDIPAAANISLSNMR